jgi:hypothetical protein
MRVLGLTLGDWRVEETGSSGLLRRLGHEGTAGAYVLSARCCGIKGAVPGARHTWLAIACRGEWTTLELTDVETLSLQTDLHGAQAAWTLLGKPSEANRHRVPARSNRVPDGRWFGQAPRLESMIASEPLAEALMGDLDIYCGQYCFRNESNLLDNNCCKLVSYLLWRVAATQRQAVIPAPAAKLLIGYRDTAYWDSLYAAEGWRTAPMRDSL